MGEGMGEGTQRPFRPSRGTKRCSPLGERLCLEHRESARRRACPGGELASRCVLMASLPIVAPDGAKPVESGIGSWRRGVGKKRNAPLAALLRTERRDDSRLSVASVNRPSRSANRPKPDLSRVIADD
jgi:hypothetical protein